MSLQPGTWRIDYFANVHAPLGTAINMTRVGQLFPTEVAAKTGNRASLPNVQNNPYPQKSVTSVLFFPDRYKLKLAFTITNTATINYRDIDAAFWEAVKNSGAPGISVNRIVQAMPEGPGGEYIDGRFSIDPPIALVERNAVATQASAAVAPPSIGTAGRITGEEITESRNPTDVGQSTGGLTALGESLSNAAGGLRDTITGNSTAITVAVVAVAGLAALVAIGYTVRSFK